MRVRFPHCTIDLEAGELVRADRTHGLTAREVELLTYFLERTGTLVTREAIEREVWKFRAGVRSEAVPVAIRRLREKLELDPRAPKLLVTHKNQGYTLQPPKRAKRAALRRFHTPFVPRPVLSAAITSALASFRVVTLVGPGGAGKTRLANEVLRASDAGCVMVELARVEGTVAVTQEVLVQTGLQGSDLEDESLDALCDVVFLDNAEHVVDAVAELVEELVEKTTSVRFVITSRIPLRLPYERVVDVGPLDAPAAMALFEAYFVQLAPEGRENAAELVSLVDHMPLAIELLARQRSSSVEELITRVRSGDPLNTRTRRVEPRQQSVDGAIQWSWDLLSEPERALLGLVTLWPGKATVEGLTAVSGAPAQALVTSLCECSMLQWDLDGVHLLQLVRAFVEKRSDLTETHRNRWRQWVLEQAEAAFMVRMSSPKCEADFARWSDALLRIADAEDAPDEHRGRALLLMVQLVRLPRVQQVHFAAFRQRRARLSTSLQQAGDVLEMAWHYRSGNWAKLEEMKDLCVDQASPDFQIYYERLKVALAWRADDLTGALERMNAVLKRPDLEERQRVLCVAVQCQLRRDIGHRDGLIKELRAAAELCRRRDWPSLSKTVQMVSVDMLGWAGRVEEAAELGVELLRKERFFPIDYTYETLAQATCTALLEIDPPRGLEVLAMARAVIEESGGIPTAQFEIVKGMTLLVMGEVEQAFAALRVLPDSARNPALLRLGLACRAACQAILEGVDPTLSALDTSVATGIAGAGIEIEGPALLVRLRALVAAHRGEPLPEMEPVHPHAGQFVRTLEAALNRL